MTPIEVMDEVFSDWFAGRSWDAWRTCVRAIFGLPLSDSELPLYRQCTDRSQPSTAPAREAWPIVGRRGGKSTIVAFLAVYLACFRDYSAVLSPGERGHLAVIAADRRQAQNVMGLIRAFLDVPLLRDLVVRETRESIDLSNGITLGVMTASYRTTRGYTVVAAILDEVAFWRSEDSAQPDVEIVNALRPAMATIPDSLLLAISTPYARRGLVWQAHSRHFGRDGDPVFVWEAPSQVMNRTISEEVIEAARAEDPVAARAEWDAEFRDDLETYVDREVVERAVVPGRVELPPTGRHSYFGFVDASGGKVESFVEGIGHREEVGEGVAVIDALREVRAPFDPDRVVAEFAPLLRAYRVRSVVGDRYGGSWVAERFSAHGIRYEESALSKSNLYKELLPAFNSRRVELPDNARLVAQLCALERRVARGGRDSIDHPPRGMDDLANVCAGLVWMLLKQRPRSIEELDLDYVLGQPPPGRRFVTTRSGRIYVL